jgi:tetratricopeptide (TPR) repeat protein
MPRQKKISPADAFHVALRTALQHYNDHKWLGQESILTTPYFLGQQLRTEDTGADAVGRGQALCRLLQDAAADLWPGHLPEKQQELMEAVDKERQEQGHTGPCYAFCLLELQFFRQLFPPRAFPATKKAIPDFLGVSSTRFYVHLDKAITRLGKRLLDRVQSTLRLEQPIPVDTLVGRDHILTALVSELSDGHSVFLSGQGGVGKTSLGAAIGAAWPSDHVLWFTFHPGLNDDFGSVIFAIGHFLNQRLRSSLWLYLIAHEGRIGNIDLALGFLRADLQEWDHTPPLFCFDEVDLLHTSDNEPRRRTHIQVLEFLDSLRGLAPLLFIGQRALLDTDSHYTLSALNVVDTERLLNQANVYLDNHQLHQLHHYTGGNPRLLELYMALHHSGDEAVDVGQLASGSSAQPLFHRLWKRLDNQERQILAGLSVLRSRVSRHAWPDKQRAIDSLIQRRLVKVDLAGGVVLLPFFRQIIYRDLPIERRQHLHHKAGLVRAQYGDYTKAAYHFWQAEDYGAAVDVWYPHQDEEIQHGQSGAAHEIFRHISPGKLTGPHQKQLKLIQNRLFLLAGEAEHILEGMENFTWHLEEEITADAFAQWGYAHAILGNYETAQEKFDDAIEILCRLTGKIADLHFHRGQTFHREADFEAARCEIRLAQIDIHILQGQIESFARNFPLARSKYLEALELAKLARDERREARVHMFLTYVANRQGQIKLAQEHAARAMAYFQKIGDRQSLENVRAELASAYLNVRQFEAVIEPSEKALRFFEQIKHERWITAICNNLAEAYFETGQIDKAKEYVFRVLRMEVPRSLPYAHYTLGLIYEKEEEWEHCEATLQQGIQIAKQIEDKFIEAYLQRLLGNFYIKRGVLEQGQRPLQTALDLFAHMGLDKEVVVTRENLERYYPDHTSQS